MSDRLVTIRVTKRYRSEGYWAATTDQSMKSVVLNGRKLAGPRRAKALE